MDESCKSPSNQLASQDMDTTPPPLQKEKTKFICKLCLKDFNYESYFKMHKMFHFGEVSQKCPNCGECYQNKGSAEVKMHKCLVPNNTLVANSAKREEMDNSVISPDQVALNVKMNTTSPSHDFQKDNKFTCKLCQKNFNFEAYFKLHKMYHYGEISVNCSNCGQEYQKKNFIEGETHKCSILRNKDSNLDIASSSKSEK